MKNLKILILLILLFNFRLVYSQSTPQEIFAKGVENFLTANFQDAIKYFDEYIQNSPNDFRGYNYRGLCYQSLENYQKANEDFTKVLSLGKTNFEGYINRGNTYLLQGLYASAAIDFTDAIQNNPNDVEGYIGRSRVYTAQGNFPNAITDLNSASNVDPKNARVYINKVWVYLLSKDTSKVFENVKTALYYDSNMVFTNFKSDLLYLKVEYFSNILNIVNEVVDKYPNSYLAYFTRGMVFYLLNKYENAKDDFITSLKLDPNNDPEFLYVINKLLGIIKRNS